MNVNYTEQNEKKIKIFSSANDSDNDFSDISDKAVAYLKADNSFKSFDEGLIQLFELKKYNVDLTDRHNMADFLISKLHTINSDIENKTVYSWFLGTHRPKIEAGSRRKMYELCFSLELSLDETIWFFQHVYCDRAFNCHTIDEAVFYYAFSNGLSYKKALEIIETICQRNVKPPEKQTDDTGDISMPYYTSFIENKLEEIKTIPELVDFLISSKYAFTKQNQSASKTIKELLSEIIVPTDSKNKVEILKRKLRRNCESDMISPSDYKDCGLIIQEIIFDSLISSTPQNEYIKESVQNRNFTKNASILRYLLSTANGAGKAPAIPYVLRNSFPSKKTLSDILSDDKIAVSKSYDTIRKTLILLEFYIFYANIKLDNDYNGDIKSAYINTDFSKYAKDYISETNYYLYNCGYEDLYAGNPYDWIFLCAAHMKKPLDFFKSCFSELLPEE